METGLYFDLTAATRPVLIRGGTYAISDQAFETEYLLEDFHALHLYSYSARIRTGDGVVHTIAPGDVTLTPAGVSTRYALERPGTHLCVHFELACGNTLFLPFLTRARTLQQQQMIAEFGEMIGLFQDSNCPESWIAAENLLLTLLYRLQRAALPPRPADPRIVRLLEYLDRHSHQVPEVAALARRFGVSQTHLTRKFKEHTRTTIARYVMNRRVDKACYLLSTSRLSVKEIGLAVGYSTPQEFNKRFRQVTGISPSAYRRPGGGR